MATVRSGTGGNVAAMPIWIGTSGWQYRHWRDRLYAGVPQRAWFERYVEAFDTVELNVTFYNQPRPEVFARWAERVPEDFVFAVKASRFLTHVKRLRDPKDSIDILLGGAERLGRHLGPILLQLPPDFEVDVDRLEATLDAVPEGIRVAFEPRHRSWLTEAVYDALRRQGAALCWADRRRPLTPAVATASWGYVRFHGGRAAPRPCYGDDALAAWAERVRDAYPPEADVYTYFNNDHQGCAARDAGTFADLAAEVGLQPTRTAPREATPVG